MSIFPLQPAGHFNGGQVARSATTGMQDIEFNQNRNALADIQLQETQSPAATKVREAARQGALDEATLKSITAGAIEMYPYVKSGNDEALRGAVDRRYNSLLQSGRDVSQTGEIRDMLYSGDQAQVDQAKAIIEAVATNGENQQGSDIPAGQAEFEALIANFSPEDQVKARRIKSGLTARAVGSSDITITERGMADIVAQTLKILGKGREEGKQEAITEAIAPQAEAEREQDEIENAPEAISKSNQSQEVANLSLNDITKVRGYLKQARTSGISGKMASYWPGSTRKDLDGTYAKLKGRYTLEAIGEMKAQSATGATGFGQLNEKELDAIQSAVVRFDSDMSVPAQLQNLQELQRHIERQKAIAEVIKEYNMGLISEEEGSMSLEQQFRAIDGVISTGDNGAETGRVGDVGDREVYETNRGWFYRDTEEPYR